jgi:hypothetical protein
MLDFAHALLGYLIVDGRVSFTNVMMADLLKYIEAMNNDPQ